jgi:hypothetical protein
LKPADILFTTANAGCSRVRRIPAEPQAAISGTDVPLKQFIEQTVETVKKLGLEKPDSVVETGRSLAQWQAGAASADPPGNQGVPLKFFP